MLAIGLWCTEALPAAVTSLLLVVALVLFGAVPGFGERLVGFADPVAYFLIGVLTIGLAVSRSGLAERVARFFLRRSRGSARSLYLQLLLAFPLLTFILPSATTRTGILVHVYEQALELGQVPRRAPLVARGHDGAELDQPARLHGAADGRHHAGGCRGADRRHRLEPVAAADERAVSRAADRSARCSIYFLYRRGFDVTLAAACRRASRKPLSRQGDIARSSITVGASALWLTDALHHWHPAVPALLAWILLLMPRIGVLTWSEFERDIGWTNFFVLASSLSLASALGTSGASAGSRQFIVERGAAVSRSAGARHRDPAGRRRCRCAC